jgi:hypothetical protein
MEKMKLEKELLQEGSHCVIIVGSAIFLCFRKMALAAVWKMS